MDERKCQALVWNRGRGKVQCGGKPLVGCDLCATHSKRLLCGRVTGPLPHEVLEKFWRSALSIKQEDQRWYSRHLMWQYALQEKPSIENLADLDE